MINVALFFIEESLFFTDLFGQLRFHFSQHKNFFLQPVAKQSRA
ncbi:hypothetical protein GTCCBUS3UF5_31320 [Geobacillus thermoleovorans CCB_US3_UF5]|uniref:Uncharacterized protein n=3 Tax=Geobacillus TaxID=129337 RepID=A0A1Q5T4A4_9BACL|nr:hypothetical protein GTCCBUS3UF5_31320 [Geobacillus thermoleovorans CCB_US3_UF5]EQB95558.1 hypothetical protein GA8_10520 [Geobacillus sp. A8]ESU73767.1 hypothetical protein T260_00795 [Geobacillus sp. MAS1]OKO95024.1 hypothetical protein BRO54_1229 [Geobacillus proteiniphilus]